MIDFIAAIELGSSKIAGIVGRKASNGSLQVLAYAQEDSSSFIRKGVIFNLAKTAQALTSIINQLEASLTGSIGKVYVGVSGQSMHTVLNVINRPLEQETIISQELVDAICDDNHSIPLVGMDILEVAPQEYRVGSIQQRDPIGIAGKNIEGHFLNIVARSAIKKNLVHSFEQAKIEVADLVISPLATARVVLTENEMKSGCVLIDFGADTTTVSVFKNDILRFLTVIPLGGNNITHDLTTLQLEEEEAESLKKQYGDVLYEEQGKDPLAVLTDDRNHSIELRVLNDIIAARAEEIIANVWNQIEYSGYSDKLLAGVVITGGGINLKNLDEMVRSQAKAKVRVARTIREEIVTDNEDLLPKNATLNTLFGLLASGTENCCVIKAQEKPVAGLFEDDEDLRRQEEEFKEKRKREKEKEEKEAKNETKKSKGSGLLKAFKRMSDGLFSDDEMK